MFDFDRVVTVVVDGVERDLPLFVVEGPDYHLRSDSPAIDAGLSDGAPRADIEDSPRPCGGGVDIGAYEYQTEDCGLQVLFQRGNVNADANLDISDATFILGFLFLGEEKPTCRDSADVDDNGALEVTDAVYLLNHLFLGGEPPKPPYPGCGVDLTDDAISCESYGACE
jgi:hypothetical protein